MIPVRWKTVRRYFPRGYNAECYRYRPLRNLLVQGRTWAEPLLTIEGGAKLCGIRHGGRMELFISCYTQDGSDIPKGLRLRLLLENARA